MSNQAQCIILANPDIAGIGVRIAVYIQAFVALIPSALKIAEELVIKQLNQTESKSSAKSQIPNTFIPTAVDWTDIFGVVYPNLILGCALIISSVVQALTFSLTVYHALIILNLSWIVTFSAAPAFIISDNDKKRRIVGQLDNHTYQLMALCHVGHLTLSAAFGLWFFSSVAHFDKSGNGCTSSTLYYALWENVHADNPAFRRFWLAIYSIVVIPAVNFLFVALTFFLAFVAAVCAALPLVLTMSCCYSCLSDLKFQLIGQFVAALMILFPPALMVALTEKMISINRVGTDEKLWTFGQTFALLVALPPTWNSAKLAKGTFINIRTMIYSYTTVPTLQKLTTTEKPDDS